MTIKRASGLLLHVTSLPGRFGCGTMGEEAVDFVDFLAASGQSYWQVLPLGPACSQWHFSPYSSPSAFAGNEMLVSPEALRSLGWISATEKQECEADAASDFCDLQSTSTRKTALLAKAARHFFKQDGRAPGCAFARFCDENGYWLEDYSLFRALADHFQTFQWTSWPAAIARRQAAAVAQWQEQLREAVLLRQFEQFVFFEQWRSLKKTANSRGIRIIGDIPFYVNFESADAWAHPEIFQLDRASGLPVVVAGVPPDYFSASGQRWGNPLFRWRQGSELHPGTTAWWTARIRHLLQQVDVLRIDHFRGFDTYWAIPASAADAISGQWQQGPGADFFAAVKSDLGDLPLIAEDLGELTPGVEALRDRLGFPGMKILQFAFDGQRGNPYLPHNFSHTNCLVYTGTHDNNTSNGWFYGQETSEETKLAILDYLNLSHRDEFHWQFIRLAMQSIASLALFPVQDVLGYDERFRMNIPGQGGGNWRWRLRPGALNQKISRRLLHLTTLFNRLAQP